jgi:hypothetical protein
MPEESPTDGPLPYDMPSKISVEQDLALKPSKFSLTIQKMRSPGDESIDILSNINKSESLHR